MHGCLCILVERLVWVTFFSRCYSVANLYVENCVIAVLSTDPATSFLALFPLRPHDADHVDNAQINGIIHQLTCHEL